MQTVSENWKNGHKRTMLNESYVEVSLSIGDPEALAVASPKDNGAIYISDTSSLTDGVDKKPTPYCTLEQNIWVLDGERKAIQESESNDDGFIGDVLCNEVCVFDAKMPTITIGFGNKVFSNVIPGITITWSETYGEFADNFMVIAYSGDNIIAEKEVIDNKSVKSLIVMDIAEYDRIVVQVKKWCLPYRRARVEEIFVGLDKVYSRSNLFDYSHKQVVDPVSTSLPKSEISFSIDNIDGEYNPLNPQGLAKYLMERQEINARYGLKLDDGSIEWIKGGTFYLSEWYAKQNGMTADFTARDLLEFMSATYYDTEYIEKFEEITNPDSKGRTLKALAESVLASAKLPRNSDGTEKWFIHPSLDDEKYMTKAPLPNDTLANCLQIIANAGQCVLYQDRTGTLRIEPLEYNDTDYKIDSFNSYTKSEITLSKPIKQVNVTVYEYSMGEKGVESTTIEEVTEVEKSGETIIIDNPLITDSNHAASLGSWLATHLGHRMTLDSSWRVDVRLDALDIVTNENSYNTNRVRMTEVEFKYNGAFKGTGKGKVI